MKQRAGLLLAVALLLLTAGIQKGRVDLLIEENLPAVSIINNDGIWVELGEGFPTAGVHQFIDGVTPCDVIQMTLDGRGSVRCLKTAPGGPLESGEFLSFKMEHDEIIEINRRWMTAGRRMILNVKLRPQTMSPSDWQALPGIGPKLAASIELDRQKNGEFSSFTELERVSGIGPGRLASWKKYF